MTALTGIIFLGGPGGPGGPADANQQSNGDKLKEIQSLIGELAKALNPKDREASLKELIDKLMEMAGAKGGGETEGNGDQESHLDKLIGKLISGKISDAEMNELSAKTGVSKDVLGQIKSAVQGGDSGPGAGDPGGEIQGG
jgi:hypothetical protein